MPSKQVLLVLSAFLASTTSAFHVNPAQASPSPTQLGYTTTMDLPESASFEENMRNLVIKKETTKKTPTKKSKKPSLPNMMDLSTRKEFNEQVKNQQDRMTIVRFHAPFCKACKAMQPAWERLAREHPGVNFVNVAYNNKNVETRALVSMLQVYKVPFGQVYLPGTGLVEKASFGKQHFRNAIKHIEWYAKGECELTEDVDEDTLVFESPYTALAP